MMPSIAKRLLATWLSGEVGSTKGAHDVPGVGLLASALALKVSMLGDAQMRILMLSRFRKVFSCSARKSVG